MFFCLRTCCCIVYLPVVGLLYFLFRCLIRFFCFFVCSPSTGVKRKNHPCCTRLAPLPHRCCNCNIHHHHRRCAPSPPTSRPTLPTHAFCKVCLRRRALQGRSATLPILMELPVWAKKARPSIRFWTGFIHTYMLPFDCPIVTYEKEEPFPVTSQEIRAQMLDWSDTSRSRRLPTSTWTPCALFCFV